MKTEQMNDAECYWCGGACEAPRDPGAYIAPDPDCLCECHVPGNVYLGPDCECELD